MKFITQMLLFLCFVFIGTNVFPKTDNLEQDYTIIQNIFCFLAWLIIFLGCGVIVNTIEIIIKRLDEFEDN